MFMIKFWSYLHYILNIIVLLFHLSVCFVPLRLIPHPTVAVTNVWIHEMCSSLIERDSRWRGLHVLQVVSRGLSGCRTTQVSGLQSSTKLTSRGGLRKVQ